MKTAYRIVYSAVPYFLLLLMLNACTNEFSTEHGGNTIPDLVTQVTANKISGFVNDENGLPVANATVKAGMQTTSTNRYGYFESRNISVKKNAAVVKVEKAGFFPGIRSFIIENGKSAVARIQLIEKTAIGTFNAGSGGAVTSSDGLKITFPAAAVVVESSGTAYTGNVTVYAHWIDPTSSELPLEMPGDLRGISNGNMKILTTYGMAAVELRGAADEKLQIASGKKATMNFPIPASMTTAPASLPLWWFDEDKGLWIEEGSAVKTGNEYIGDVAHFSFWNCDVPSNYVVLNLTVQTNAGAPIEQAWVRVRVVNGQATWGITDSTGSVSGAVPSNANLVVEVFPSAFCLSGTPVYTQSITTTNTPVNMGTVTLSNASLQIATITGQVNDCSGQPLADGHIFLNIDNFYYYTDVTNGVYSFDYISCGSAPVSATVVAEDITLQQQSSAPVSVTLTPGSSIAQNLVACGTATNSFLNITLNSSSIGFASPADSLTLYRNNQGSTDFILYANNSFGNNAALAFSSVGIAVGSQQPVTLFYLNDLSDTVFTIQTPPVVTITEYGTVGEFVAGTFSGDITGVPSGLVYGLTGSFRVRRQN